MDSRTRGSRKKKVARTVRLMPRETAEMNMLRFRIMKRNRLVLTVKILISLPNGILNRITLSIAIRITLRAVSRKQGRTPLRTMASGPTGTIVSRLTALARPLPITLTSATTALTKARTNLTTVGITI